MLNMDKINQHLGADSASSSPVGQAAPASAPMPGHGVPQFVSEDCGKFELGPMRDGEMVVRFFGMKDVDDQFTSGNVLVQEVHDPPVGRSRRKSSAAELATYGLALGKSVFGRALVVHAGFWKAFQALNKGCLATYGIDLPARIVSQWQQQLLEHPSIERRRLVITGHSMGGAFACFTAYCIYVRYHESFPDLVNNTLLIILGAPKFSRLRFTNWINAHFAGRVLRLELRNDNVIDLPPLPGWFAPGNRLLLSRRPMEHAIEQVGEEVKLDSHHFSYWNVIRHAIIQFTLAPDATVFAVDQKVEDCNFRQLVHDGDITALKSADSAVLRATVVSYNDQYNQGAMHIAAASGSVEVLHLLLEHGGKINKRDNCFWTPLHRACNDGQWDASLYLINAGAIVDAQSDSESTPLIYACQHPTTEASWPQHQEVLEALLAKGANILHRNSNGECAVIRAIKAVQHTGCTAALQWLIANGASLHPHRTAVTHPAGFTPLHFAVMTGKQEAVQFLLANGSDPDHQVKSQRGFSFQSARTLAKAHCPQLLSCFPEALKE